MEKIERLRIVLHDILLYGKRRMRVTCGAHPTVLARRCTTPCDMAVWFDWALLYKVKYK